jgi:hypothetical protein
MGLAIKRTSPTTVTVTFTCDIDTTHVCRTETPTTWKLTGSKGQDGEYGAEAWVKQRQAEAGGTIEKIVQPERRVVSDLEIERHLINEAETAFMNAIRAHREAHKEGASGVEEVYAKALADLKAEHEKRLAALPAISFV